MHKATIKEMAISKWKTSSRFPFSFLEKSKLHQVEKRDSSLAFWSTTDANNYVTMTLSNVDTHFLTTLCGINHNKSTYGWPTALRAISFL